MIYLLLNKESVTAGELAKHYEVSSRTIYRDVELLSSTDIPIYMTKGKGGISLLPNFMLNKTVFTNQEKTVILSAMQAVDAISLEKTNTTVNKIASLLGKMENDWIEVDFSRWESAKEEATTFATPKAAILDKTEVQPDGSFLVELTMPQGEWVYYYVATFGECCEVLEPLDIRMKVKGKLQKMLNQYL